MQLNKKKELAGKVLGVGKNRIILVSEHLEEIKEAITRQDIIDLHKSGAILIKEVKGRRKIERRKRRRGPGKIKKRVNKTKTEYITMTRKLRSAAKALFRLKKIDDEKHKTIRKMIRASRFKSKRHFREMLEEI